MSTSAPNLECLCVWVTIIGAPPMRIINDYVGQICRTYTSVLEQCRLTGTIRVRIRAELKRAATTEGLHRKMAHDLGIRDELMAVAKDTDRHGSDEWIRSLGHVIVDGPYTNGRRIAADYCGQDLRSIDEAPTKMQREILELLQTTPDPRKIIWYWGDRNVPGCVAEMNGIIKYCAWRKLARVPRVSRAERMREQLHRVGPDCAYIFDARTRAFRRDMRECMEFVRDLKAGFVESRVHGRDELDIFCPPHIVILAYTAPSRKMLDSDQWIVKTIVTDRSRK